MSFKLTPRLQTVADFVPKGSIVADIGTDHAYLPIYLILNGIAKRVYACDIKQGPLASAAGYVQRYLPEDDRISLILTDGIEGVPLCDVYAVAGMGGETVCGILGRSEYRFKPGQKFILQPMTARAELRKYLYTNGYDIIDEKISIENAKKFYCVIYAQYTGVGKDYSQSELYLSEALLRHRDADTAAYYEHVLEQIKKIIDGKRMRDGYISTDTEYEEALYNELRSIEFDI